MADNVSRAASAQGIIARLLQFGGVHAHLCRGGGWPARARPDITPSRLDGQAEPLDSAPGWVAGLNRYIESPGCCREPGDQPALRIDRHPGWRCEERICGSGAASRGHIVIIGLVFRRLDDRRGSDGRGRILGSETSGIERRERAEGQEACGQA